MIRNPKRLLAMALAFAFIATVTTGCTRRIVEPHERGPQTIQDTKHPEDTIKTY